MSSFDFGAISNMIGTNVGQGERIGRDKFFKGLLADRSRGLANAAQGQIQVGLDSLESRGLGTSSSVGSVLQGIQQQQAQGVQQAGSEIFGQQFALQQQLDSEDRGFRRNLIQGNLDFERQAALMRLQAELSKQGKGGWLDRVIGAIGGAAGGYLTGGPAGAIAGGASGFSGG